jgi:hypothetical protein
MTPAERVKAVADFGFTERQARFLVTVLLYSGVCVPRQYAAFAGIAYGHKVGRFFDVLANYNFAVVSDCLHNRARVYHMADARLYDAIGQPHSRYRRPLAARQVPDRLLRVDALVSLPDVRHISTEDEKVALFGTVAPSVPRERLPHVGIGGGPHVRLFPDDQPVAVTEAGRVVFTYVVAKPDGEPFRAFMQRHADLLSGIAEWTVRVVLPKPFADAASLFEAAARQELTGCLRPDLVNDLRSYFGKRRAAANRRALTFADPEFWEADVAFNSPRFRQLYRRWLVDGDSVFESLSSAALTQALERGTGRIESHVLDVSYGHLSPVVSTFRACRNGVEGSDIAVAQPQPPSWLRPRRGSAHLQRWRRAVSAMDNRQRVSSLRRRPLQPDGAASCAAPDSGSDRDSRGTVA